MSNPNPFVPKGSLLEQQTQRRSRLKISVFCIVAVGVTGLVAMLIQGCKRDTENDLNPLPTPDTNQPAIDTSTNPPIADTNPPVIVPPVATNPPVIVPPVTPVAPAETAGSEYTIVSGDTLAKIAKKNGVSLKALEAANPGVDSKHLHVGKKLVIPAGGSSAAAAPTADGNADAVAGTTYTVKPGDSLYKIAKQFGVHVKAIKAANPGLDPSHIKVGQKLTIPAKSETAAPAPVSAPVAPVMPAPVAPPVSTVPATPAPAPAAPANQ